VPNDFELLRLIGLIYDAVDNSASWTTFLEQYASLLSASATFFQLHRLAERSSRIVGVFGGSARFEASYNEHYGRMNIWRDRGRERYVQGHAFLDQEMCPRGVLRQSEFYNDYLVPMGAEYSAGGTIRRERDEVLTIGAIRDNAHGPFGTTERIAIEVLLPHLTRASAIAKRLEFLDASESALDNLDVGIVFVTADGQLIHGNRAAEQIVARGDGLNLRNGRLRAVESSTDAHLRDTLREATSAIVPLELPLAITVSRPSSWRCYQLLVAPLRHGLSVFAGMRSPQAVILIIDVEGRRRSSPRLLSRLYGLTAREAAIASVLSSGKTLEATAEQLRMTYETARSHLRRIFDKTNTSRQTELILLLARLPKQSVEPTMDESGECSD